MVSTTTRIEPRLLAVGGYTQDDAAGGDGAPGLTTWWWDGGTGLVPAGAADLASPSFVCWHPTLPVLYAVSEVDDGVVTTMEVADDGSVTVLSATSTGGAQPCWVATDPIGVALLIANYGSGSMAVIALDDAGRPAGEPVVVSHQGSGPVADRQEGPHVHQVVPTADGHVLATDLGTDRIVEYRIDRVPDGPSVAVAAVGTIDMPAGSGTRHITLAAGGKTGFVTGELDATVTVIRQHREHRQVTEAADAGPGRWSVADQVPASRHQDAQPSQLLLGGGDRWLLVANRGPDTLAVLDVLGGLAIRHEVPTGQNPRYFVLEGNRVLLACQGQDTLELFTLDEATGALSGRGVLQPAAGSGSPFHAPACIAVRH